MKLVMPKRHEVEHRLIDRHGLIANDLHFRPIEQQDLPFLKKLYGDTRMDELEPTGWSDDEKSGFLAMQFRAQHSHYVNQYPNASFMVVLCGGEMIGRLYIDRWPEEWRIIDIALLRQWRSKGLGSAIMEEILTMAMEDQRSVSIHVETNNPAMKLYRRLGFKKINENGVYHLMRWNRPKLKVS